MRILKTFFYLSVLLFASVLSLTPEALYAAHGVSVDGKLKYPAAFSKFDYASLDAKKGGSLTLHDLGGFDKVNPFTLKGLAPFGLEPLIFEQLAVGSLDEPFAAYGFIAKGI